MFDDDDDNFINDNPTDESNQIDRAASVRHYLDIFERWLDDKDITEICVNRPGEVWTEKNSEWEKHQLSGLDIDYLKSFSVAIARYCDTQISETNPILSAILPDGQRIQIVFPSACEPGTVSITIRKPNHRVSTLSDYESAGFFKSIKTASDELSADENKLLELKNAGNYFEFLKMAVALEKVIIIAGETGSGKTTFMKALMQEIPETQRIITIEDVPELFLPNHPNHVHLFYPSEAKEEENAPVTAASLLKSCLRMKPTRILLAELRGGETFDFINIAASGHGGSITSCHAGSASLTFERLALMVLQNRQGRTLPYAVIRRLLYMVVDVVAHVTNDIHTGKGRHISELWYEPALKRELPVVKE